MNTEGIKDVNSPGMMDSRVKPDIAQAPPGLNSQRLPKATFIDDRKEELVASFKRRVDLEAEKIVQNAIEKDEPMPGQLELFQKAVEKTFEAIGNNVAITENDAMFTNAMSAFVGSRYTEMFDTRLIPSIAVDYLIYHWDDSDGGVALLFPVYEREERLRRLKLYRETALTLEQKYDQGKIVPPKKEEA